MTYKTNPGENKSLSETYAIKTGDMNESAYFLSLTENALGAGLLTEADIADMQRQIYAILAENIRIGTNGKSTSVASAKAGELMESILYVLDCFCLHKTAANTDEKALNGLVETFKKKAAIGDCYREGKKLLDLGQEIYKKPENILDGFELPAEVLKELLELDQKMEIDKKIVSQSKLTDREFNLLCDEIAQCKTAAKKAELITESLSSAGDFLDILGAGCLYGGEYLALFERLLEKSVETLAFLIKTAANFLDSDEDWRKYLALFVSKQSEENKKIISEAIKNL